ncbi:hypothetical protein EJD97_016939 [Solanum chilense]|uniref:CCHC-type domain-containing protein n=1 Tax=Solanum chilense TaxID=4083 RepID=A0A6N2C9F0_SOLCI|nr:hypothetical protein EJD97_016939 [Solanum chilense]
MTNSSQVNVGTMSTSTVTISTTSAAQSHSTAALASVKKLAKFCGVDFKRYYTLPEERFLMVYNNAKTSKELWDALEKKYKIEDAGMKKFIVAKFLDYKMIDSKTIVTQVQELQVTIHDLLAEGLIVNDVFQVAAIIEKLPPLWKNFKNYLKHKCKEMTVEDLKVRLRIEEDNKTAEKRSRGISAISGVNIVEEDPSKLKKSKKTSGPKINPPKNKFNGSCFNCGKHGHWATLPRS